MKNVCEDLIFAMMIKNVETLFGGGSKGKKTRISEVFQDSSNFFCLSATTTFTKLAEKVYLGVLQHPIKFRAEILKRNFYS